MGNKNFWEATVESQNDEFVHISEISNEEVDWLVEGILAFKKITGIFGLGGVGKSNFLMRLFRSVYLNEVICDDLRVVAKPNAVYYFDFDGGLQIRNIQNNVSELPVFAWKVNGNSRWIQVLWQKLQSNKQSVFVLDSVSASGLDIADANIVSNFLRDLRTNIGDNCVLLVGHLLKGALDVQSAGKYFGSTQFRNLLDSQLMLFEGAKPDTRILQLSKARFSDKQGVAWKFKGIDYQFAEKMSKMDLLTELAYASPANILRAKEIVQRIARDASRRGYSAEEIAKFLNKGRVTVYRWLKETEEDAK